jgi:hypothetical protein
MLLLALPGVRVLGPRSLPCPLPTFTQFSFLRNVTTIDRVVITFSHEVEVVTRVGWVESLFCDDLPAPPHFCALGVLVRALVDLSADLSSHDSYIRLWQVLFPLALGPDTQTVSQTLSRQAAIQVLAVLRRLYEFPGNSLPARLSLGLVLSLLPPEVFFLSAVVVHDPPRLRPFLRLLGRGGAPAPLCPDLHGVIQQDGGLGRSLNSAHGLHGNDGRHSLPLAGYGSCGGPDWRGRPHCLRHDPALQPLDPLRGYLLSSPFPLGGRPVVLSSR